jgi:hypothetical protein
MRGSASLNPTVSTRRTILSLSDVTGKDIRTESSTGVAAEESADTRGFSTEIYIVSRVDIPLSFSKGGSLSKIRGGRL